MLEHFFTPKSVAVIGASSEPGKVGYDIVRNLKEASFQGDIFPVIQGRGDPRAAGV